MVALHCSAGARIIHLAQPSNGSLRTLRFRDRISLMECLGGSYGRSKGGSIDSVSLGLRLFSTKTATAPEVRIDVIVPMIAPIIRLHMIASPLLLLRDTKQRGNSSFYFDFRISIGELVCASDVIILFKLINFACDKI